MDEKEYQERVAALYNDVKNCYAEYVKLHREKAQIILQEVARRSIMTDFGNTKVINSYLLYEKEIKRRLADGTMTETELHQHGILQLARAVPIDAAVKECLQSPDGKHKYGLLKSGRKPEYGCVHCRCEMPLGASETIKKIKRGW